MAKRRKKPREGSRDAATVGPEQRWRTTASRPPRRSVPLLIVSVVLLMIWLLVLAWLSYEAIGG